MTITLIVLVLTIALFIWGRVRSDIVALSALVVLILSGILTPAEALSGFSSSVVIMMVGLFVVGGAILSDELLPPNESVPQRGTRMSSPVQARDERSAGMEKSSYMDCEVTRGVTRAFYAHQCMTIQRWNNSTIIFSTNVTNLSKQISH